MRKRIETIGKKAYDLSFSDNPAIFKKEPTLKWPDAINAGYAIQDQTIPFSNDNHFGNVYKLRLQRF